MPSTFFLAPQPYWTILDKAGKPADGALMYPVSYLNNSLIKPVFMDPGGTIPWPMTSDGAIVFNGNGVQGPFYWEDTGIANDLYTLFFYDKFGESLGTIQPYPVVSGGGGSPITTVTNIDNFFINGQFRFYSIDVPLSPIPSGETAIQEYKYGLHLTGGLYFTKNVVGNTDSINITRTSLSDTSPLSNPLNIFTYTCSAAGSGTALDLGNRTFDVKSFSNEQIAVRFDLKASGAAPVGVTGEIYVKQFFGTGGAPSPTVDTSFSFVWPNGVFGSVPQIITVPSVAGKSLGTNGDDYFEVGLRFPIGSVGTYQCTNMMSVRGALIPPNFIYETQAEVAYKVALFNQSVARTGDRIFSENNAPRIGWLAHSDGQTIGGPTSVGATYTNKYLGVSLFDLYVVWWTNANGIFGQPIVVGGAGATALADWNAGKQITAPLINGRVFAAFQGVGLGFNEAVGDDHKVIPLSALPNHNHASTLPLGSVTSAHYASGGNTIGVSNQVPTGYSTSFTGAGGSFDVRQLTSYLVCFVKL